MPSVALQILFFFVAGVCIIGILFFVSSSEEKDTPSSALDASVQKIEPPLARREESGSKAVLGGLLTLVRKWPQIFGNFFKQPRDIFVHTQGIIARFRGQVQLSVLNRTFEQDSETKFSLHDVSSAPEAKLVVRRAVLKAKQAPKLVQKLQDQFEERSEAESDKKTENEEEFWLGILRQNPHVAHPYKKLGEIYLKRGDYKEAQASLSFALTKDPNDQEAAALLAEVKEKRGAKK